MTKNKKTRIIGPFLSISYKAYKPYYFSLLALALVNSALTVFGAYSISAIISYLEQGEKMTAIYAGLIVTAIEILLIFLKKALTRVNTIHQARMREAIDQILSKKILSLPFAYLEDPYYIELKKNAQMGIGNMGAIYTLLYSMVGVLSSLISLISLGAIIFSFDPILIAVMGGGIFLSFLLVFISMKTQINFYKELLPINFKFGYYLDTLYGDKACKDFRLYNTYDVIDQKFEIFSKELSKYFVKIQVAFGIYQSLMSLIRYAEMALVYILVGIKTLTEKLPISRFSLTATAAISFSDCITSIIDASSNLIRSIEYIRPFIELMRVKEDADEGQQELAKIESIEFDHVTFKYPKNDKVILDDVSFAFKKGEKISIVGLNGAGKTTIVKLLCRLYHPDQGRILINGAPIEEYKYDSYIAQISAVFQDYQLFNYSIRENIRPGISTEEAKKICTDVGIADKIEELPKKYESALSKFYDDDGVELSGGQKQKIAIARALAKPAASLLILDE